MPILNSGQRTRTSRSWYQTSSRNLSRDSNEYGESIAKLSNMLGGGVLLQRFGDLVKGRRSSARRMEKCFHKAYAPGHAGRPQPGHTEEAAGQYNRNDICAGQDRAGYGRTKIRCCTVWKSSSTTSKIEVDEHLQTSGTGTLCAGRRIGSYTLSFAGVCERCVCRQDTGRKIRQEGIEQWDKSCAEKAVANHKKKIQLCTGCRMRVL